MTQGKLRLILASTCFLAGAAVAGLTWNHTVDANTYLDMARFVSVGDWAAALNPFWGLSYGWIMGFFFFLTAHLSGAGAEQEIAAIRITNVFILLLATGAFDFLLVSLLRYQQGRAAAEGSPVFGRNQLVLVAYALFLWSCFCNNWPALISPDLLVCTIFFVLVGLLLRVLAGASPVRTALWFSLTLAAGYVTKAIFVPLGLVLILCLVAALYRVRRLWPALPLALLVTAAACAPYYAAVARHTRGVPNAASLNYAWHVDGLWNFIHWHGEGDGTGKPIHPTALITRGLRAYAFAEPIHATYPPWYDPSYFYAGFKAGFYPARQAAALRQNSTSFAREMAKKPLIWTELLCVLGLLTFTGGFAASLSSSTRAWLALWPVWVPSLTGGCIYLAVHIEQRYVQGMSCCLLLALSLAVRPGSIPVWPRKPDTWLPGLAAALIAGMVLPSLIIRVHHAVEYVSLRNPLTPDAQWKVAERLRQAGVAPRTQTAVIGEGMDCLWAFLARVRIVAEVPHDYDNNYNLGDADAYWTAPGAQQQEVLEAFGRAGAAFVIAEPPPGTVPGQGWIAVAATGYYYHALNASAVPQPAVLLSVRAPADSRP